MMDRRNIQCCMCWFMTLAVINFLIALLIAYKTLIGECESEVCNERGTCLTNKDGYRCQCNEGFVGEQCQYQKPPDEITVHHYSNHNKTKMGTLMVNLTQPTVEVKKTQLRDPGFTSEYWTFIIVYTIGSNAIFILAFFIYIILEKNKCIKKHEKDYYGIEFKPDREEEMKSQTRHLVSDASGLDIIT